MSDDVAPAPAPADEPAPIPIASSDISRAVDRIAREDAASYARIASELVKRLPTQPGHFESELLKAVRAGQCGAVVWIGVFSVATARLLNACERNHLVVAPSPIVSAVRQALEPFGLTAANAAHFTVLLRTRAPPIDPRGRPRPSLPDGRVPASMWLVWDGLFPTRTLIMPARDEDAVCNWHQAWHRTCELNQRADIAQNFAESRSEMPAETAACKAAGDEARAE